MKLWFERALAVVRWGWEKLVALAKVAFAKLQVAFNTIYDPPPKTIRFWFWSFAAVLFACWLTFAFVNSWFYKPTVQALTEFRYAIGGDDLDVVLPEIEPLPPVPTPAASVSSVEVVCHDMSDTPHCETVYETSEKRSQGTQIEEVVNLPPTVAKPPVGYKAKKSPTGYKRRKAKPVPYVTYWGF